MDAAEKRRRHEDAIKRISKVKVEAGHEQLSERKSIVAKKAARGSVANQRRLDAFAKATKSTGAEWASADSELLKGVIDKITALGGAITIGLSRDNGAYMLTLLLDGERETLWFNGDADLEDELRKVLGMLEAME